MPSDSINKILFKRSDVSSNVPDLTALDLGELGVNTYDGKIFIKTENPYLTSIKEFVNSDDLPYIYNESLSGVVPKDGGNTITEVFSDVLGGFNNDISGGGSTVVNGEDNDIESDHSIIGSGLNNKIKFGADYSFIAAGQNNRIDHSNVFTLGSNLSSHANDFTYVNNISAQGIIYGDGSGLTNLTVGEGDSLSTVIDYLSTNNVLLSSAQIGSQTESTTLFVRGQKVGINTNSPNQVLTVVGNVSSTGLYYGDGSQLTGIVAGDTIATTLVRTNSANWELAPSVYTTVNSNSATTWNYQGTDIKNISANWESAYTTVNSNSANFQSVYTNVQTGSANWDSKTSLSTVIDYLSTNNVFLSSAQIGPQEQITSTLFARGYKVGVNTESPNQALTVVGNVSSTGSYYGDGSQLTGIVAGDTVATTFVRTNSANWDSTYTTVQSNSSTWGSGGGGLYLPLSGGNLTGNVTTTSIISSTNVMYASGARVVTGHTTDTTPVYKIRALTQVEYNALGVYDDNTIYFIKY